MRASLAIVAATTAYAALAAVQWLLVSPGTVTYAEFRFLALAAVPTLTVILCARWVDAGRREE